MYKFGDIVLIDNFKDENGVLVPKHSFVVISDKGGIIEGLDYNFVASMLCSFHNEEHKKKKLRYSSNVEIKGKYVSGSNLNKQDAFAKADKLYYYKNKSVTKLIGHMDITVAEDLKKIINSLNDSGIVINIYNNL